MGAGQRQLAPPRPFDIIICCDCVRAPVWPQLGSSPRRWRSCSHVAMIRTDGPTRAPTACFCERERRDQDGITFLDYANTLGMRATVVQREGRVPLQWAVQI